MKQNIGGAFCIFFLMTSSLPALDFDAFLKQALAGDRQLAQLELLAERATVSYLLVVRESDRLPGLTFSSGAIRATGFTGPAALQASPQANLVFPRGLILGAAVPVSFGAGGFAAVPGLSLSVPLLDTTAVSGEAAAKASFSLATAKASVAVRKMEVIKSCVDALAALARTQASVKSAERAETMAARELEKTVRLEGLAAGSIRRLTLERAVVEKRRISRDGLAAQKKAEAELSALAALVATEGGGVVSAPPTVPRVNLEAKLPRPEDLYAYRATREGILFQRRLLTASGSAHKISLEAGASYAVGTTQKTDTDVSTVVGAKLGISATIGDWSFLVAGLMQNSPGAELSIQWKPSSRRVKALLAQDWELQSASLDAALEQAYSDAVRAIAAMVERRTALLVAEADLAEDLAFAKSQEAAFKAGLDREMVSENEYREASLFREECEARVLANDCARYIWKLEYEALTAIPYDTESGIVQ